MKMKNTWHSRAAGWQTTTWRERKKGGKRRLLRTRPATYDEIPKW